MKLVLSTMSGKAYKTPSDASLWEGLAEIFPKPTFSLLCASPPRVSINSARRFVPGGSANVVPHILRFAERKKKSDDRISCNIAPDDGET